jgi:hypothetical protein
MAQRNRVACYLGLGMHHPGTRPVGRCPVQPGSPLVPDQVNVLLLFRPRGKLSVVSASVRCFFPPNDSLPGLKMEVFVLSGPLTPFRLFFFLQMVVFFLRDSLIIVDLPLFCARSKSI